MPSCSFKIPRERSHLSVCRLYDTTYGVVFWDTDETPGYVWRSFISASWSHRQQAVASRQPNGDILGRGLRRVGQSMTRKKRTEEVWDCSRRLS